MKPLGVDRVKFEKELHLVMQFPALLMAVGLLLFTSLTAHGQEYTKQFFQRDYQNYQGAELIVDPDNTAGWNNAIYLDLETSFSIAADVAWQTEEYTFATDPAKLPPGPFRVVEILDRTDNSKIRFGEARFKLIASDETEFWFRYQSKYKHTFPWLVGKIELDEASVCAEISSESDDFTGKKTIRTPLGKNASLRKIVENGEATTYLSLYANGSTLNVGEKGVIILMEDGSKLEFPGEEIDTDAGRGSGWRYSAFIRMDDETLTKLSTVAMDKWRLYIYDQDFDAGEAEVFRIQVGCIKGMN